MKSIHNTKAKERILLGQADVFVRKGIVGVFVTQDSSIGLMRKFQIDCFKGHVSGIGGNYN